MMRIEPMPMLLHTNTADTAQHGVRTHLHGHDHVERILAVQLGCADLGACRLISS